MSLQKVAIVTGANKGIGFAIVKGLCQKFEGIVYLTSRNEARGKEAVKSLKDMGLNPQYHQLDIDNDASVKNFHDYVKDKYGGIDLLINNAAIAFSQTTTQTFGYQAEHTVKTNYFGTLRVCLSLFPLLRPNSRVVNVSSSSGHLSRIPSQELRSKFSSETLDIIQLNGLMNDFVEDAKKYINLDKWGSNTYVVSKVGVTALTRVQQQNFNNETPNRNISVNAVHPGFVDTDMTNHRGVLTIDEGAKSTLYVALNDHNLKGQYVWSDNQVIDWLAPSAPANPTKRN